jgi:hypothetical protein
MLRLHRAVALVALSLIGACSSPAAPSPDLIVGLWRTDPEPLSPRGTMVNELTFMAAGRYAREVHSFGVYAGQGSSERSSSSRTVGRYQVEGHRLRLQPDSLIESNNFSPGGAASSSPSTRTTGTRSTGPRSR